MVTAIGVEGKLSKTSDGTLSVTIKSRARIVRRSDRNGHRVDMSGLFKQTKTLEDDNIPKIAQVT